jgi:gliding motility-associated-like protein
MGHYLGLYHTFDGGCTNNNCLTDGDLVCDTPPDQTTASVPCNGSINSCNTDVNSGFATDQNDLSRDYMDYGNIGCFSMFTQGQADRMNWHINNVRSSLLNCMSCSDPCPAPITANFSTPGSTVNAGTSFTFVNSSTNATSYEWYVNGVLQSTATNFPFTFAATGAYTIKLVAKSGSPLCTPAEKVFVINAICPVSAGFTKSATTANAGTNIIFTNTTTGATTYEWYVNGGLNATTPNFTYTNTIGGQYIIKLIAKNTALNCIGSFTDTVYFTCPVSANFTPLTQTVNINTTIPFTNTSSGATTYQWLVNNVPVATTANFSFTPSAAGSYIVSLVAGNGVCSSRQSAFIVANDTCLRTTFQKSFGGSGDDAISAVKSTADGGYIAAGYTSSFGAGGYDGIIIKTDSKGDVLWSRVVGGSANDYLYRVIVTMDGGYLASGYTSSFGALNVEGWLVKVDAGGTVQWSRKYNNGNPNGTIIWDVCQTSDGGYAFAGVYEYTPSLADAMVGKTNANGVIEWCRYYSGSSSDQSFGIIEDNGVLVVSAFGAYLTGPYYDGVFMKVDRNNGNVIRARVYDIEARSNWFTTIAKQGDEYILGCNNNNDFSNTAFAYITMRVDSIGNVKQMTRANSASDKSGASLFVPTADGGYMVVQSENTANSDVHMRKNSVTGTVDWTKRYGTTAGLERMYSMIQTQDLSLVGGGTKSAGNSNDFYLLKTDALGNVGGSCTILQGDGTNATPQYTTGAYTWPEIGTVNIPQNNTVNVSSVSVQLPATTLCTGNTCFVDADTCLKTFQRSYGSSGNDVAVSLAKVASGGYILGGYTNSFGAGGNDAYLVRTNTKGDVIWAKAYGGSGDDAFDQIAVTSSGGFIATGQTKSFANPTGALFVVNVDGNGNLLWSRALGAGTGGGEYGHTIIQTAEGGFALIGSYNSGPGTVDIIVVRLDASGNVIWSKRFDSGTTDEGLAILEDNDTLVVGGYYRASNYHDGVLMKLNKANGNLIWSKSYDINADNNGFYRMQKSPGGYSILASTSFAFTISNVRQVALRTDINGNVTYAHQLTSSTNKPFGDRITYTSDGGYLGIAAEESNADVYLYKTNAQKQLVWKRRFVRTGNQNAYHIIEDAAAGGIVMAGITAPAAGGSNDILLIKTNSIGQTPGCVVDTTDAVIATPNVQVANFAPASSNVTFSNTNAPATVVTSTTPTANTFCNTANCDSLRITGDTLRCLTGDTLVYRSNRSANCGVPVTWQIDTAYAQVITSTDSLIKIKWRRSGVVKLYATITGTCRELKDSMQITINRPGPTLNLGPDIQLCANSVITLRAGRSFKTYLWQDGATDSTYTANFPGIYHVTVTDSCGLVQRDTVVIAIAPTVPFDLGPDLQRCNTDTVTITAPPGFIKYTWAPNYNINTTNGQIVKVWPSVDTIYTVVAEVGSGCLVYDTIRVRVFPSPVINLGNDTSFCAGGSVTLNAGPGFTNYVWSTGASGQTITASTAGSYWVRGTTADGCVGTDTFRILNVYPLPVINLGNDTSLCQGSSLVLNPGAGFSSYQWQNGDLTPTFTAATAGLYWVQVTTANGCTKRDSLTILNVYPRPVINLGNDTSFCAGGSVTLNAGPGFTNYVWSTGAGGQTITASTAGTYWVRGTTADGCVGTDTLRILNVYPLPVINLGNDTSLCQGSSLVLNPGAGFASYQWQNGALTPTFTTATAGLYWVQVTTANGCTKRDSLTILNIYPRPVINLGNDTSFCTGGSVTLNPGAGFVSYLWQNGTMAPTFTATTAGLYWVEVQNSNGCTARDSMRVTAVFPAVAVNLGPDRVLCAGNTVTLNPGAGFSSYTWQDNSGGTTFTTGTVGTYWVRVTSANGCVGSDTMRVLRISPLPVDFVPEETGMCLYEPVTIYADGGYATYLWSNGTTRDSALFTVPGTYWVQVTNSDGCTAREDFIVFDKQCPIALYIPTGFSPNGDGKNDVFRPGVFGIPDFYRMEVFNRYGERIFVSNDFRRGWDGTYKGAPQNIGAYVWMCTYQFKDQPKRMEKGSVLLIR